MSEIFRQRIEGLTQMIDEYGHSEASGAGEVAMLLRRATKLMQAIDAGTPLPSAPEVDGDSVSDVRAG